ncbi:SDR family NAD(P)-dependent oxidoreductase [Thalassovita sp.]|jgi:3-oxoacyl-[acyl-carrier protein] reductase|uniref:SDR family NAD(P)-dependent oxidoreductase n=1 Tax=Thalassovita sp. TaxID=1979401 RepID=UPI003B5A2A21
MTTRKLEGKVALVTGAASGIGQAVALRFAEEGAKLVLADLNPSDATQKLIADIGGTSMQVKVNTTSDEECQNMVSAAVEAFGKVDTGVFAAGIRQDPMPILEMEMSAFDLMIDINMKGVLRSSRAFANQLMAQGTGGTIVNIASTAGKIPIPGSGPYCVAKAGVIMMTKVMALELAATGIRVNALAPGFTETPMWDVPKGSEEDQWAMSLTPMGRNGTAREQADAALFLASGDSSYTTGQTLYSAGGQFVD